MVQTGVPDWRQIELLITPDLIIIPALTALDPPSPPKGGAGAPPPPPPPPPEPWPPQPARFEYVSLAPDNRWKTQEVYLKNHPLISEAAFGDLIKVTRHVITGYDSLFVRAFRMTLHHKPNEGQKRNLDI